MVTGRSNSQKAQTLREGTSSLMSVQPQTLVRACDFSSACGGERSASQKGQKRVLMSGFLNETHCFYLELMVGIAEEWDISAEVHMHRADLEPTQAARDDATWVTLYSSVSFSTDNTLFKHCFDRDGWERLQLHRTGKKGCKWACPFPSQPIWAGVARRCTRNECRLDPFTLRTKARC